MSTDDLKQLLIPIVFEREAIWDQRHSDHHNRFVLEKLWKEVAAKCGTSTNDVKKKWKTLRQQFKDKWEKLPVPTSGDPAPEESIDWPYFQLLLFLRDNFEPKGTNGNLNSTATVDDNDEICEIDSDYDEDDNPSLLQTLQPYTADGLCYRKWSRHGDSIGNHLEGTEKEMTRSEEASQSLDKHDEDIAFFTSLLPHARRMTPLNKMYFRIEVQKLVMERSYGVSYGSGDGDVLP